MRIRTVTDEKFREIELHVCNHEQNEETRKIIRELHALYDSTLTGTDEKGNRCRLPVTEILSFFAEGQRVIALGISGRYAIPQKLYELEEQFGPAGFVRISRSELVNYRKIKSLDLRAAGTIRVIMQNGYETYTSRRNVAKIRELLLKEA